MKRLVVIPPSEPSAATETPRERRVDQRRLAIGRRTGRERRDSAVDVLMESDGRMIRERRQTRERRRRPDRRLGLKLPAILFRSKD